MTKGSFVEEIISVTDYDKSGFTGKKMDNCNLLPFPMLPIEYLHFLDSPISCLFMLTGIRNNTNIPHRILF